MDNSHIDRPETRTEATRRPRPQRNQSKESTVNLEQTKAKQYRPRPRAKQQAVVIKSPSATKQGIPVVVVIMLLVIALLAGMFIYKFLLSGRNFSANKNSTVPALVTSTGQSQTNQAQNSGASQTATKAKGSSATTAKDAEAKGKLGTPEEEKEFAKYDYYIEPGSFLLKPVKDADPHVVFLTVDDAPDKYSMDMAKIFKENNVPAIFMVNGHFLYTPEQKKVLKEIYDMGFEIGNHTMTHPFLTELTHEERVSQILDLNDMIKEVIGKKPTLFRPPFGDFNDDVAKIVHDDDMVLMMWSFVYDIDKENWDADVLADKMLHNDYLRDGANILMHDREWTRDAIDRVIKGYKEMGYGFVDAKQVMPYKLAKRFREVRGLDQD